MRPYKWNRKKPKNKKKRIHSLTFENGSPTKLCLDGERIRGVEEVSFEHKYDPMGNRFGYLNLKLLVDTSDKE